MLIRDEMLDVDVSAMEGKERDYFEEVFGREECY